MAVTPNTDEAFLREVDEELRRDQVSNFWRDWGRWLIGAVVLALVAFGGVLWWQNHQRTLAGEQGEKLQAVVDDLTATRPPAGEAAALAQLADSHGAGYRATARLAQADILMQKGDVNGAVAKFGAIAADATLPQPFRDLALIRQTTVQFDQLKPDMVVSRLRALAVKGNPWFGSAGELVAAAYLRMNRRDLAGQLYSQIAQDEAVPDSIRQRAVQMAGALGGNAVAQIEEKKAQ